MRSPCWRPSLGRHRFFPFVSGRGNLPQTLEATACASSRFPSSLAFLIAFILFPEVVFLFEDVDLFALGEFSFPFSFFLCPVSTPSYDSFLMPFLFFVRSFLSDKGHFRCLRRMLVFEFSLFLNCFSRVSRDLFFKDAIPFPRSRLTPFRL